MPAQALTTEFLATLPGREPASGAVSYFDTEIKGFLLEHRASGGAKGSITAGVGTRCTAMPLMNTEDAAEVLGRAGKQP